MDAPIEFRGVSDLLDAVGEAVAGHKARIATLEALLAERPAAPDPALLALARLGAWVVRESFQDGGGFYVDFSGNDLDDEAARTGLMVDGGNAYGIHLATGIREQIAALLAPDGAGEVTA